MRIAIAGGGIAGMAAGLGLVRAGHEVTIVERDAPGPLDSPLISFDWHRPGVPQFGHPHVLLARACVELLDHAPDVYTQLLTLGATEIPVSHPDARPDPELRALGVRRPLLEWTLRRALADEPGIRLVHDTVRSVSPFTGDGGTVRADFVVDARGRSAVADREALTASCGMGYYSRFYRLHDSHPLGPTHLAVPARADFGFAMATLFWADNQHMGLVLAIPSGDHELRVVRAKAAFDEFVASSAVLSAYVGADRADPVTGVRALGNLRASFVSARTREVLTIGDALCHTNPLYGWGASFALAHAFALPALLEQADPAAAFADYAEAFARDRYEASLGMDAGYARAWRGEKVDFLSPGDEPDVFRARAFGLAGLAVPHVYQRHARWIGCLDSGAALDADPDLRDTVQAAARQVLAHPAASAPALPGREELLARLTAALP